MIIDQVITDTYTAAHGDCVEFLRGLPGIRASGTAYFLRRSPRCTPTATHPATWATSATMQNSSITSIFSSPSCAG